MLTAGFKSQAPSTIGGTVAHTQGQIQNAMIVMGKEATLAATRTRGTGTSYPFRVRLDPHGT